MSAWDEDYINEEEEGYFEFDDDAARPRSPRARASPATRLSIEQSEL
jgi:hypothetical protein